MNGWTNIWDILGISYTTDISEIKQAYARRAKDCHPEEHPEEFRRLQRAYKSAVQIAKSRKSYEKEMREASEQAAEVVEGMSEEPAGEMPRDNSEQTIEATFEREILAKADRFQIRHPEWFIQKEEEAGTKIPDEQISDFYESELESDFTTSFDYSEIRDEDRLKKQQAKADFLKRVMYIIWNPFARNNVRLWEIFLRGQGQETLFTVPEFRVDFVRLLYQERFAGWHRDQILFFREYLEGYQMPGQPALELQMREWNWLLQNAGSGQDLLDSPCITSEENENYQSISIHNKTLIYAVIHVIPGSSKEEQYRQYLTWYMNYAEKNEDKLQALYRDWVLLREQRFEHTDPISIEKRCQYMIWNPYVRNNINMWKCFLSGKRPRELFGDPGFRLTFAGQVCRARFAGWHRDQIAFLWQFLTDFEPDGKLPGNFPTEEWTRLFQCAAKGRRAMVFSFLTRKEKTAYDNLYIKEIFSGVEPEPAKGLEEQYLDWYWRYAEQNEVQLTSIYERWTNIRRRLYYCGRLLWTLPAVAAVILVLLWEILVYKPYGSDLKYYQKLHERIQDMDEDLFSEEFEQILQEYESQ